MVQNAGPRPEKLATKLVLPFTAPTDSGVTSLMLMAACRLAVLGLGPSLPAANTMAMPAASRARNNSGHTWEHSVIDEGFRPYELLTTSGISEVVETLPSGLRAHCRTEATSFTAPRYSQNSPESTLRRLLKGPPIHLPLKATPTVSRVTGSRPTAALATPVPWESQKSGRAVLRKVLVCGA